MYNSKSYYSQLSYVSDNLTVSVVTPSPMLEMLSVFGHTGSTAVYPIAAVYVARTEPQVRCYAHGCDNISNVAFISRLRLVNGACDYKPATLVVGH